VGDLFELNVKLRCEKVNLHKSIFFEVINKGVNLNFSSLCLLSSET